MSSIELTQLARAPLLLLTYAEQRGIDTDELMQAASLTPEALKDPDSRIPLSAQLKLWRALIEHTESAACGLEIGRSVSAEQLGVVGYTMAYSQTLGQAYQRLARYMRIISEATIFEVVHCADSARLQFTTHPYLVALRHPIEGQVAAILTVGRKITQTDFVPLEISLPTTKPINTRIYRETFRCRLRFDQPEAAFVLTTDQMQLPLNAADGTLSGYLEELASAKLHALRTPQEPFGDTVRRMLWSDLSSGKPELSNVASQLGISARTLQRRLRQNGTSYSLVLDELRREVSSELLVEGNLAVSDVAYLLGYSEPSAFQRAFRRWYELTPRQFKSRRAA